MNTHQAKAISLCDYIQRIGHTPTRIYQQEAWFKSPLHPDERTPSFKVDIVRNIWYDFGIGVGGNIIDFVGYLHHTADIPRILSILESTTHGVQSTFNTYTKSAQKTRQTLAKHPAMSIERCTAIEDIELIGYLDKRKIPLALARLYLQEVHYHREDKHYKALAVKNQSGGYEVRNPYFKGTLGKKDYSLFAGEKECAQSESVAVFEGMYDFLSVLAYYGRERVESSVIVMHSVALLTAVQGFLTQNAINKAYAYLDHDAAGKRALEALQATPNMVVEDRSRLYAGFKDMNEFLVTLNQSPQERKYDMDYQR